jgi:hypothetical protein
MRLASIDPDGLFVPNFRQGRCLEVLGLFLGCLAVMNGA